MALIDCTGFIHDDWVRVADDEPTGIGAPSIVSLTRLLALPAGAARGVAIANDVSLQLLSGRLDELDLIAIDFPSSADGRGFSVARSLRRLGFDGELRASGPLIADQFAFALGCGFDTVEIPAAMAERQGEPQWLAALASIEVSYQVHYAGRSVLEQRHAAREHWSDLAA